MTKTEIIQIELQNETGVTHVDEKWNGINYVLQKVAQILDNRKEAKAKIGLNQECENKMAYFGKWEKKMLEFGNGNRSWTISSIRGIWTISSSFQVVKVP